MAGKAEKLEMVKKEIRSLLLTDPNGLTVAGLLKCYREMVGYSIPYVEFGYSTPDEFLFSIPDVVSFTYSRKHNAHVMKAVADESTKHIEKLVSKQKTSKSSLSSRRLPPNGPPRFRHTNNRPRLYLPSNIKSEIYNVAKEFKNGLSLPNFMAAYRRKYGKELAYKNYGYYTVEDCLNIIPQILLRFENNEIRIFPIPEENSPEKTVLVSEGPSYSYQNTRSNTHYDNKENKPTNILVNETVPVMVFSSKSSRTQTMNALDDFTDESSCGFVISPTLREQFKRIMRENPQGIWVSKFPIAFQKLAGHFLDHQKLGCYNLIDLFSELPEIFRIEVLDNCKDDWMLYDATSPTEKIKPREGSESRLPPGRVSKDISEVSRNVRLLLQANCDGIGLDDFTRLYAANCGEYLDFRELGFTSLSEFLENIAETVPLIITEHSGKKLKVHYKKEIASQAVPLYPSPRVEQPSDVPPDAVAGCAEYELQQIPEIPENANENWCFPVYISSVIDPDYMYIQLYGEDTSIRLAKLMDELELFYYRKESEYYWMPKHYIISGAVCAAQWPGDGHWHRIRISSVPSNDSIVAFFVDYGTKERIPSDNLRFLKKNFMELPAQAIRANLCNLRPVGDTWDPQAKELILNKFGHLALMACVAQNVTVQDSLPLALYDTSGEDDVHLDAELVSKCLAKYVTDEDDAQEFLGVHSPSGAETGNLEVHTQNTEMLTSSQQAPLSPESITESLRQVDSMMSASTRDSSTIQSNPVINISNVSPTENIHGPKLSSPTIGYYNQNAPLSSHIVSHGSDSEVFESDEEIDDDDNPEVNSISKRYVKRINLDDGYSHVHLIVINDTPFMPSGDITYLLWNHDEPDFVRRKLKNKEIFIPNTTVKEVGYEQLFYQLERFQVRGVKSDATGNHYIVLFPFKNVIDILNIFGHPSITVRDIIDEELFHFDPLDPFWKTISEEEYEENVPCAVAPNLKDHKSSLYELKASLQALKFRKRTLTNQLYSSAQLPSLCNEIENTEAQCTDVERKIRELQVKIVSHQREKDYD